jgi:cytochrome c-type biogenesis protein CcmH/NrfG
MAEEVNNVVLEMLQRIRASQERTEFDIAEFKSRVSSLEQHQGQTLILLGTMNQRFDRFDERLSRIERRLDLVDQP